MRATIAGAMLVAVVPAQAAVDTNNEKLALMEWGQIYEAGLSMDIGAAIGQDDQQQLIWGYPGILWSEISGDVQNPVFSIEMDAGITTILD